MLKIKHFSDSQIIDLLHKGGRKEDSAIQYLLDDNRKKIASYVLKNNGDKNDAYSILVEGVTHLVFNVRKDKFRGDSKLSTYLFAICRGLWLKELKKRKRFTEIEGKENVNENLIEELTPLHHFSEDQLKKEMSLLLNRLGNACQEVLMLWAKHFSMTEISNKLGYKNSQIAMNKKNRCLGKLRDIIGESTGYSELLKSFLN